MKISDKGLDIIKEFEGYEKALPNGDCKAYRCYVAPGVHDGKWTIGWGCTEGITESTVWTRAQAEDGLRREIGRFEDAVTRLCRFIPNQNQFDALVSFAYNVGEGGLAQSSVLRLANSGDFHGAANAFALWNKSQGYVVSGLVRRRALEAALFASTDVPVVEMPQTVDAPVEGWSASTTAVLNNTTSTTAAGGIAIGAMHYLGLDPMGVVSLVKTYGLEIAIVGCVLIFVITEAFKHFKGDSQ